MAPKARLFSPRSLSAKYRYKVVLPMPSVLQMVAAVSPLAFSPPGKGCLVN